MHYKLYNTKISEIVGIENRVRVFVETLNEVELYIENHDVYKRKTQKTLDMIEELEKIEVIGHLPTKLHAMITEVSSLTKEKWFDSEVISLLCYYDEIMRYVGVLNFQYEKEQAEIDITEMDKREEALSNIDNLQ